MELTPLNFTTSAAYRGLGGRIRAGAKRLGHDVPHPHSSWACPVRRGSTLWTMPWLHNRNSQPARRSRTSSGGRDERGTAPLGATALGIPITLHHGAGSGTTTIRIKRMGERADATWAVWWRTCPGRNFIWNSGGTPTMRETAEHPEQSNVDDWPCFSNITSPSLGTIPPINHVKATLVLHHGRLRGHLGGHPPAILHQVFTVGQISIRDHQLEQWPAALKMSPRWVNQRRIQIPGKV